MDVVDLGCGSGKLINEILPSRFMRRIIGVDVDGPALEVASRDCTPGFGDYHFRRPHEFNVTLFKGSILDQHHGLPFQPSCVTLIEVIEHVYEDQVPALAYTIFAHLNPETVFITTPNRDFNVHFPDPIKLRNDDHKYEWTRAEFAKFVGDVERLYGYTAEIKGVGTANGRITNGYCT